MALSLDDAVLVAIAKEGSPAALERMGFTAPQIASSIKQHLKDGRLNRIGSKFVLAEGVNLPDLNRAQRKILEPLTQHAVEKMDEDTQYTIEHRTFTQIRERVRNQRETAGLASRQSGVDDTSGPFNGNEFFTERKM